MMFYQIPKCIFIFQICLWTLAFYNIQNAYSAENKHFLWEIKSKQNSVYLLGYLHAMPKTIYPLTALIEKTYQSCDTIVFENLNVQKASQEEIIKSFQMMGVIPSGKSIKPYLSNETFKSLLDYLLASDLKLSQFIHMKPWMCSAYLFQIKMRKLVLKKKWVLIIILNLKPKLIKKT